MKLKNTLFVLSLICIALLCISCASATQSDDNLTINDDSNTPLEQDNAVNNLKENATNSNQKDSASNTNTSTSQSTNSQKTEKIKPYVLCNDAFIHKKSNTFKVKVYSIDENKNKITYHKNVKLTVKVKIGKKTKVYHVKTNKKGDAKILNVKNLKVGTYKVTVTTADSKYQIKEKGLIVIYGKAKKTTTVKLKKTKYGIEGRKNLNKKDLLYSFYEPKDAQYDKGVYAETWNLKKPIDAYPHSMITKAKFFFKNKKTGKIISKTSKLTKDKFYGWKSIKVNPIKGYTPIKTQVWYLTR